MNKSKIEWCDFTWNPVTGCLHGCNYCYARRIANRFAGKWTIDNGECIMNSGYPELIEQLEREYKGKIVKVAFPFGFMPTFHRYRLCEPQKIKKPSRIFVSSMGDLFGEWVPDEWINEVMKAITKAPQHTYLFLTKNPSRYYEYIGNAWQDLPEEYDFIDIKMLFGTTITKQQDIAKLSPAAKDYIDFLSIEPLLEEVDISEVLASNNCFSEEVNLKWVIVGAQTGPGAKPPKQEWVQNIIDQCRAAGVSIFLKNNLKWPEKIQEFPDEGGQ